MNPKPLTVVIADDHATMRETVIRVLQPFHPQVYEAESIAELMSILPHIEPDLIVLDLAFTDSSPHQTLAMIPEIRREAKEPVVIAVSGVVSGDFRKEALDSGADNFVSKQDGFCSVSGILAAFTAAIAHYRSRPDRNPKKSGELLDQFVKAVEENNLLQKAAKPDTKSP